MGKDEIMENLTLDDIPDNCRDIAELVGIDAFLKLCRYAAGENLYFPLPDKVLRKSRDRKILEDYKNGSSLKQLSQKYNIGTRQIRNIIKESRNGK